jgi:hypothetical protein
MVNNVEALVLKFSRHFGIPIDNIQGCTEEEILQVEREFGRLPALYKKIMMRVGKGIKNIKRSRIDFDFFLNDVIESTVIATELSPDDDPEYEVPYPKNLFVIYHIHSGAMYFILLDENSNYDVPVFIEDFNREDKQEFILVKAYESLWDWINDFLDGRYNFILYRSDDL